MKSTVFSQRGLLGGLSALVLAVTVVTATGGATASAAPQQAASQQETPLREEISRQAETKKLNVGPKMETFPLALTYSLLNPTVHPEGANDFSCDPSPAHPNPVVLVHGTVENRYNNWARLSPRLKAAGYCVFALNYGGVEGFVLHGLGDIPTAAEKLSGYVDKVLAATGARKVDIVGHSQGGMMPRYYIKNLGGEEKVDKLVALSPSNHGTTLFGLSTLLRLVPANVPPCVSCLQQMKGSEFMTELNAGGETNPEVRYTVVATRTDEVVTPYTSALLKPAPNVKNYVLQDVCESELTEHLGISYNEGATQLVLNALDPANATPVTC